MKIFQRSEWEPIEDLLWYEWNDIIEEGYQIPEDILRECIDAIGFWNIHRSQKVSIDFCREYKKYFDKLTKYDR